MSLAAYQSVAVNECCFLLCLLLFGTSIRQTTQLVATFLLWRPCSSRARSRVYVNYCIPTEHDLLFRVSRPSLFAEGLACETKCSVCQFDLVMFVIIGSQQGTKAGDIHR